MPVTATPEVARLSTVELQQLVAKLLGVMAAPRRLVAEQCDEIARLRGLKARPAIKPSGMQKLAAPQPRRGGRRRGCSKSAPRVSVEVICSKLHGGLSTKDCYSAVDVNACPALSAAAVAPSGRTRIQPASGVPRVSKEHAA